MLPERIISSDDHMDMNVLPPDLFTGGVPAAFADRRDLTPMGPIEPLRTEPVPGWFRLLALGLTTRQVADRLVISAKTADHHVQHIYTKIGVSTRGAAALFAIEHGILASDG